MQFVCDAPSRKAWFRIETEAEALRESEEMKHAVEKFFRREREKAIQSYKPDATISFIERDIGLARHIDRTMPLFLTLRDHDGTPLATAMLPPNGAEDATFRPIIVGPSNRDPYPAEDASIAALASHYRLTLSRERCFPYGR